MLYEPEIQCQLKLLHQTYCCMHLTSMLLQSPNLEKRIYRIWSFWFGMKDESNLCSVPIMHSSMVWFMRVNSIKYLYIFQYSLVPRVFYAYGFLVILQFATLFVSKSQPKFTKRECFLFLLPIMALLSSSSCLIPLF